MTNNKSINTNSEMLFVYDAKMSNPNGDMDNENKPRMDYDTGTNLVSDLRIKRYLRDYFETQLKQPIFVTNTAKDAKDRADQLKKESLGYTDLIDVRLFGAVYAAKGGSDHLTGPVQFNWGYSLNPVEINESATITCSFSSGEGVGKDYRVKYSLIAFSGGINAYTAEKTQLTTDDLGILDTAMIKAIPAARTRSKDGQWPRFYMRVVLEDKDTVLKDLREYLVPVYKTDNKMMVRSINDMGLDISKLTAYLKTHDQKIGEIILWQDDSMMIDGMDEFREFFESRLTLLGPGGERE